MNIYLIGGILVFIVFLYNGIVGLRTPADRRTALQKICASVLVIFKGNLNDAGNAIRTPELIKKEGLQKIEEARLQLISSYSDNMTKLKTCFENLKNELPKLKEQPGMMLGNARSTKKKYDEIIAKNPNDEEIKRDAEALLETAKDYLIKKDEAYIRIKTNEKMINKIDVQITLAESDFAAKRNELDIMKSELISMISIPENMIREKLNVIETIKNELTGKLNEQKIRNEVQRDINSSTPSPKRDDPKLLEELNSL